MMILLLIAARVEAASCVIIDAGHGSPDGGSVGYAGTEEKDLNLILAQRISEWAGFLGIPFRMTRMGDMAIYDSDAETIREKKVSDLKNRLHIAENTEAPLFLSVHMNASPAKSAHGLQVFYAPSESSETLAEDLTFVFTSRISEEHVKPTAKAPASVYLMKHLSCPAVILEYGFITNPAEEQLLLKGSYQQKLAYLTRCGVLHFINHKG